MLQSNGAFPLIKIDTDMKRFPCIVLLFCLAFATHAFGQNRSTIFDALSRQEAGMGEVIVHQSAAIEQLIGERMAGVNVETTDSVAYLKIQGYRTQVFSGNNQRASKDEAFSKEKEIKELFPDIPTYVSYTAPFWKLRIGDFRSHEEAYHMMRQLMAAFPKYGKEMYIVREEIKIPLNEE